MFDLSKFIQGTLCLLLAFAAHMRNIVSFHAKNNDSAMHERRVSSLKSYFVLLVDRQKVQNPGVQIILCVVCGNCQ